MEHKKTTLSSFLSEDGLIIDVRSPKEYEQGHIPGAWNVPLFTDTERASVGITYKLKGPSKAVEKGLEYVGPKLSNWVREIRKKRPSVVKVYCARGGMRSQSLLWLLNFCQIPALSLQRGYKNYRSWVLSQFKEKYSFKTLGGYTGSGKSILLKNMKEQVLDLEALAKHRGSLFGSVVEKPLSCEQFENELAAVLDKMDREKTIWVEDESRLIGRCCIPAPLFNQMRAAPLYFIQANREARIENIYREYGKTPVEKLTQSVMLLKKRIGLKEMREIIEMIEKKEIKHAIDRLLCYYDKAYDFALKKRAGPITILDKERLTPS